jgi:peptidoglycan/LPS O-acetylase OafA/YrhL
VRYRADVDGLRALAIGPVVLYHAGVAAVPGGFVGVDIFFVISGYLIAGLILADIEAGHFTIGNFYERRVRRIFPALFAMLAASCVAAWFLLPPLDMQRFGASVAAAAAFVSNILFASEAGYFDAAAELKPLLHTWSLGVEEQFYLFFPGLMLLLRKQSRRNIAVVVGLLALLSFLGSLLSLRNDPGPAFFPGPWRFWELSLGVLAALGALPRPQRQATRELLALAGLALIAGSVFMLSREVPFPGVMALFPCVGALLLILSGEGGSSLGNRLLATRPFVFLGLISYSLYLWHWPLIVFARRLLMRHPHGLELLALLAASLLLAVLSWRFVEKPFRLRPGASRNPRRVFLAAALLIAASLGFGYAAWKSDGWPARVPGDFPTHVRGREDFRPGTCFLEEKQGYAEWAKSDCAIDRGAGPQVLLWGDSFAAHYVPGLVRSPAAAPYRYTQFTSYSCPPVPGTQVPWAPQCVGINAQADQVLSSRPFEVVVLAARWERYWGRSVYSAAVQAEIDRLRARGLRVVLVGQGPSFDYDDPVEYVRRSGSESGPSRDGSAINRELAALHGVDAFLDPLAQLCPGGQCRLREGREFLYFDGGHYSTAGSIRAVPGLAAAIGRARAAPR